MVYRSHMRTQHQSQDLHHRNKKSTKKPSVTHATTRLYIHIHILKHDSFSFLTHLNVYIYIFKHMFIFIFLNKHLCFKHVLNTPLYIYIFF